MIRLAVFVGLMCLAAGSAAMPPVGHQPPANNDNSRSWDDDTYIDAGNILMFVTNHGNFGRDLSGVFGYDAGTFYPYVDTASISDGTLNDYVLYAAGLWIGGRVNGEIRMAVAEYSDEYVPGPMEGGSHQPDDPSFRVYKLYSDSLWTNPNVDYLDWPIDQGAPVDAMGRPVMLGDQMLWAVYNDADPNHHTNNAGETAPLGIEVQQTVWAYSADGSDTVVVSETAQAEHIGPSAGHVEVTVADPSALTGHAYAVVFGELNPQEMVWHVIDVTINDTALANQTNQTGEGDYPVVDGLYIRVVGTEGVAEIIETANQYGAVDPPEDVMGNLNSTGEWYVDTWPSGQWERMNWRGRIGTYDWEIRFTAEGSQYYDWNTDELVAGRAPFEVWNIGIATPDDPSDDVRLFFTYLEEGSDDVWGWGDRIYAVERPYYEPAPQFMEYTWDDDFRIGRIGFFEMNTGLSAPGEGTTARFVTEKMSINTAADSFLFVAPDYELVVAGGSGNIIYIKFKLYNSGSNVIEDAYISPWSDPDLGEYTDDLVGCDTLEDIWFCYNSDNNDAGHYGATPPAVGFKILSGPIVPSPGDTADFDGAPVPGHRNLPMTSFQKYINGTDPINFMESYNYMRGLNADGSPLPNGTNYAVPGDPVTGVGDLDFNPSDRRMMGTCGPVTLMPGDSQYIFIKMAVGHGDDRLTSITLMKELLNSPEPQAPMLKTVVEPSPISMMMLNAISPVEAVATFGYDAAGPRGEDFDYGTLALNDLPPIDSMVVSQGFPGFNGEVVRFHFPLAQLLTPYVPLFDSAMHAYSITGQYVGCEPFNFSTSVAIYGHRSGDLNLDGVVDISDLILMVEYFFVGGPAPEHLQTADLDYNGTVDISDMLLLIEYMFGTD